MSTSSQIHELVLASDGRLTEEMVQAAKEYISLFDHSGILGHGEYTWQGILEKFGGQSDEFVWRRMTLALFGVIVALSTLMLATGHKPF